MRKKVLDEHLSFQNRVVIETLHNEGRSLQYIANY
ncbi:helix-turn-helix domain-containing protein, partial [Limosilactobacillus galli]